MVHFGTEMRPKTILILKKTHNIRSFATIRDLVAYLRALQINFEVSTWQWNTQFCPKIVPERFSLSQFGPARIFDMSAVQTQNAISSEIYAVHNPNQIRKINIIHIGWLPARRENRRFDPLGLAQKSGVRTKYSQWGEGKVSRAVPEKLLGRFLYFLAGSFIR